MNHLNKKSLTTMETSIYDHIKKETKVLYDKKQLQNMCQIKSKIWVTRSVNTLINLGLIKEIKNSHSIESFLTLNNPQTTSSESPILLQDTNKIELNTEEQMILNFFYEQSNSGQKAIPFATKEMARQFNLSRNSVRNRIELLIKMKLIDRTNSNALIALTDLGRKHSNPQFSPTSKKQCSNQLHLNKLPTNISKTERKILAVLSLLKKDCPTVDSNRLRELFGLKKETFDSHLMNLSKEKYLAYSHQEGVITLTLDVLPEIGSYQTMGQAMMDRYKKSRPSLSSTEERQVLQTARINHSFKEMHEHTNLSADQTAICLVPDSTYEKRVFLIDTENIGLPFCEKLKSVLTPNDTIILMLSQHSEKQLIPANILHLVLNAPWKTKSFQVPIFQTKQDALDHALISELTIQLFTHQNDQFFIVSRDKGFLSAIHHLKERLNLREDQLQLIPSFFLN